MLPEDVKLELSQKSLLDFGISINPDGFEFHQNYCTLPTSLVVAYVLAIATSGQAKRILFVGFDGYGADDPRRKEMDILLKCYEKTPNTLPIVSITPTRYEIAVQSIYAMIG